MSTIDNLAIALEVLGNRVAELSNADLDGTRPDIIAVADEIKLAAIYLKDGAPITACDILSGRPRG